MREKSRELKAFDQEAPTFATPSRAKCTQTPTATVAQTCRGKEEGAAWADSGLLKDRLFTTGLCRFQL